jgi:hypothetical protein
MASRNKGKQAAENTPNREELYNLATEAVKAGNKRGAQVMFQRILAEDRRNVRVMYQLARIAPSKKERVRWLNKILEISPDHEQALATLHKMDYTEKAARNKLLLRVGVGAYVAVVLVVAFMILISSAS